MAEVKWIKLCTDVFDDEKIQLIDALPDRDGVLVIWFKLLCMAGKQNNGGVFMLNDKIAYTDEMLATIFRRPINTVRLALQTFENFGMIEIDKHRQKQKQLAAGGEACNVTSNVTVTQCNADRKDKEKDIEKDIEKEVEVVCADAHDDGDDDNNKLRVFAGLMLSENQVADLLKRMDVDIFDEYCERLSRYIEETGAVIKSHYATILKWYNEDCAVNVTVRNK